MDKDEDDNDACQENTDDIADLDDNVDNDDDNDACQENHSMHQGRMITNTTNALCVRLNRKWEIVIVTPRHPFSPGMIISDIIVGCRPLSSFTFDIYLGTS